jgi:hypothetical protein
MSEAKKKADELVEKFLKHSLKPAERKVGDFGDFKADYERKIYHAKQCAIIAVDEILAIDCMDMSEQSFNSHIEFWQAVREELTKP